MAVQFEKPIALGADNGGYALKEAIRQHMEARGIAYRDFGNNSTASWLSWVCEKKSALCSQYTSLAWWDSSPASSAVQPSRV